MREGVLFELTKDHLERGFQGVPAGYCVTSHVDPKKGLSYAGRPISGVVNKSPIEVLYLLFHGEMGTPDEVATFSKDILERASCTKELMEQISSLPKTKKPMDAFAAAILIAGMLEGKGDYREDCLDLIAKLPQIAAWTISHQRGLETREARKEGYCEQFAELLGTDERFVEVLSLFMILSFDHGGGELSAFVGKAVSSSLENMYGCLASAMTALGGNRLGGALQSGFAFVSHMLERGVTRDSMIDLIEKEQVPGFFQSSGEAEDLRAKLCYEYCQKNFPENPLVKSALMLREEFRQRNLYPNFDAIAGVMLHAGGFEKLEYAPILLGAARGTGISIQIVYERLIAKEGKGTPIMHPSYIYRHRS